MHPSTCEQLLALLTDEVDNLAPEMQGKTMEEIRILFEAHNPVDLIIGVYDLRTAAVEQYLREHLLMRLEDPHSIGFRGNGLNPSRLSGYFNVLPPSCLIRFRHLMTWE